ncbi:unnamed protein product [Parascedosporium putredinis]|uniref:Alpha/beta hydrolase fold-3 domain-containing protein n=1 Tax=Parascedosporium putredinis TaxID=1442378 RepID=A0A9P1M8S7_9PEZI|nr:unnamed protein product [Parascedosporium putredinis]CAI7994182.1 unnamed protein product [Parascedosporium putredinis]
MSYSTKLTENLNRQDPNSRPPPLVLLRWLASFALKRGSPLHWRQRLALAFIRAQRAIVPAGVRRRNLRRELTGQGIIAYCAKKGLVVKTVQLEASSTTYKAGLDVPAPTLHFIAAPGASDQSGATTLLYFHGGGYVNPMRAGGHVPFALQCAEACGAREVVFLEYALAPEYPYPAQLVQAVAAFRYLLEGDSHLSVDDIVLAGDSAGGNLVGSLLAHLASPSPYAAPVDLAGHTLKAAVFVCPWTMMHVNQASFATNDAYDYLNRPQALQFKAEWNPAEGEVWANLCDAPAASAVWDAAFGRAGKPGVVSKALVTSGSAEVLVDSCNLFAKNHLRGELVVADSGTDLSVLDGKDFVSVECNGEVHVQPALDAFMGYKDGVMMRAIARFLKTV